MIRSRNKIRYSLVPPSGGRGVVCLLFLSLSVQAQDINAVLQAVEQNNKELQALQSSNDASKLEVQSQNSLGELSVQYSPFFMPDVNGVSSSELVVSQGFDFPTLYGTRRRSSKLKQESLDMQYLASRRDVLLNAKKLCLDLIRLNKERILLDERKKNADELLAFFEKRLSEGDASIIEVNKIKMERMSVQTEVAQNNALHRTAWQSLIAMNANQPLDVELVAYPQVEPVEDYQTLYDKVMANDAGLKAVDASVRALAKDVSVSKQNWLPKLEVGYRRNTSLNEASNGFLAGVSIPLFSNRKQVKIAKAQSVSAQFQLDNVRMQTEAQIQAQFNEMQQLYEAMGAYDVDLMYSSLKILKEALVGGQLSVIEYYVEVDGIYRSMQAYMEVENQYQKVMADIYKNDL